MALKQITPNTEKLLNICVIGPPGVGKTSLLRTGP